MKYFVTIQYGTKAGNVGSWVGLIEASDSQKALDVASARIKRRKYVARIFGGDAV